MRSFILSLFSLALVALATANYGGSHEYLFNYGSPHFSSSEESRESREESKEPHENDQHPSFYTKDVIHGMGPQHSFLTVDFPKGQFQPYKPDFQPHFEAPRQKEQGGRSYHKDDYAPRYNARHEQYDRAVGKPHEKKDPRAEVSVVRTRDGKKIMTMTKPGYKMVVEEMEGKSGDKTKMVGRTVKETNQSKVKGDNGETMHQSQSYQYQVVQSESTDDKQPQRTVVHSKADPKNIDFSRFAQPQKGNFPSEFPGQYGYQQHQEFVKAQQQQNPFGYEVPEAFKGLHIPPGIGRHIGF